MEEDLQPGDFLIFQLESGYGLLRVLAIDDSPEGCIWHLAAYSDFFPEVEMADNALQTSATLSVSHPHLALTNRAFESTQVARMTNVPLTEIDLRGFKQWIAGGTGDIFDRSIRLLLGYR